MAQTTKIIKLSNGTFTYVPVTLASAVQYSYANGYMSVQDAIGTLATSQISIAEHLHDQGTDLQHLSGSATSNVGTISLDQNGGNVTLGALNNPASAGSSTAHVAITYNSGLKLNVTYTDTKPASANLTVAGNSGSQVAFNSNESTAKTLNIKGATGTPIETAVASGVNVTIKHKDSGVTAGTYGTNSTTSITAGSTGSIVVPEVTVNSYGHVTSAANQSISIDLSGLTGAMHWVGLSTTDPKGSSGATFSNHTWANGDVVTYNSKEYVLTGSSNAAANWLELGDEGSHALKGTTTCSAGDGLTGTTMYAYVTGSNGSIQHAVPNGAAAGTKNSADNNFIKSVTTDKFGHVTAYTTGTFTPDHTGTGTANRLAWWTSATYHTAYTGNWGSSTKFAYVESGVLKEGTLPTAPNNYSSIAYAATSTAVTDTISSTSAGTLTPASANDKLTVKSLNKWIHVYGKNAGANSDELQFSHALKGTGGTAVLKKIAWDEAGHIGASADVSSDSNLLASLTNNYKIVEGHTVNDLDSGFLDSLGLSSSPEHDIVTGTNTTNNYYYK